MAVPAIPGELLHSKGTATALHCCAPVLCTDRWEHLHGASPRGGKGQWLQDTGYTEPSPTPWCLLRFLPWSLSQALLRLGTAPAVPRASGCRLSPKHGSHSGPAPVSPQGSLGTGAELLCSLTHHCLTVPRSHSSSHGSSLRNAALEVTHSTGSPAPGGFSHASHSGTSSSTSVPCPGKKREQPAEAAGLESNSCSGKCLFLTAFLFTSSLNTQVPMFLQLQSPEIQKRSSEPPGKHICPVAAGQSSAHVLFKSLVFKEWFFRCQRGPT